MTPFNRLNFLQENKGAAEQEDLPCSVKSINHSEKLGWLAVQMRRPLGGGTDRLQAFCTSTLMVQHMEFGCKCAQKQDERLLSCQCRWSWSCQGFCQPQMEDEDKGTWRNLLPICLSSALEPEVKPLTEWSPSRYQKATGFWSPSSIKNMMVLKQSYWWVSDMHFWSDESYKNRASSLLRWCFLSSELLQVLQGSNVSRKNGHKNTRPCSPYSQNPKKKTPYYPPLIFSNLPRLQVPAGEHVWQSRPDCHPRWS